MRYTDKTFTLPTNQANLTDEEYAIAVGILCPKCRKKLKGECKCKIHSAS